MGGENFDGLGWDWRGGRQNLDGGFLGGWVEDNFGVFFYPFIMVHELTAFSSFATTEKVQFRLNSENYYIVFR